MTTSAPHVTITTMQHTCAGHPSRHPKIVLQSAYIVAAPSTAQHSATIDVFHQRPPDTRNFNVPMVKVWEMQVSSHQMLQEGQVNCIPTSHIAKFWEVPVLTNQTIMIIISFLGETRTTAVTREEIQLQVLVDTPLENNNKIIMLTILVQILGIMGTSQENQYSPMLGLMRDTTSSTLHPYTHLHLH